LVTGGTETVEAHERAPEAADQRRRTVVPAGVRIFVVRRARSGGRQLHRDPAAGADTTTLACGGAVVLVDDRISAHGSDNNGCAEAQPWKVGAEHVGCCGAPRAGIRPAALRAA